MVKTVEEAMELPEIESEMYRTVRETLPNGLTVERREVRPLSPIGICGDDIIAFVDADGRAMKVVHTEDGPAKCEFR